jgi:hypothetical protein
MIKHPAHLIGPAADWKRFFQKWILGSKTPWGVSMSAVYPDMNSTFVVGLAAAPLLYRQDRGHSSPA